MAQIDIFDPQYKALKEIDWDFPNAKNDALSGIHPYPARFITALPANLIDVIGLPKGSAIVDPFCGSGTTLVEAQRRNINSIGIDLNPIACLISKIKTTRLPANYMEIAMEVSKNSQKKYYSSVDIPAIPNLNHWFKKDVQQAIASILFEIELCQTEDIKNYLKLALSSIIVRVSNQESDTRYAAVENNNTAMNVFKDFYGACKKLYTAKENSYSPTAWSKIICKDILKVNLTEIGGNTGMVITSPPYPNAYEYWLYHKYRMWWLGFDPIKVRSYEIGARPHYQKKNGETEVDFYNQMGKVFTLLNQSLVVGGHFCVIIGRSVIKGRLVDNAALITDIARKQNLSNVANISRNISNTRKSFNLKYGKIKEENILIFRKD